MNVRIRITSKNSDSELSVHESKQEVTKYRTLYQVYPDPLTPYNKDVFYNVGQK